MSRIKKFNEGLFYTSKSDLYLKNKSWGIMTRSYRTSDYCLSMKVSSLKSIKDITKISFHEGVFFREHYGSIILFGQPSSHDYEKWYDLSHFTEKLLSISKKLGYEIGSKVMISHSGVDGTIAEIRPIAFYTYNNDNKNVHDVITLAYKINTTMNTEEWQQITNLQLVKSLKSINIVEGEIEDNFMEEIDNKELTVITKKYTSNGVECYQCKILFNMDTPSKLSKFTSRLNTLTKRLQERNIDVFLSSISLLQVEFLCKQK